MNKKSLFPKGFFQNNNFKEVSTKEALKGVIPLKWEPNGKKHYLCYQKKRPNTINFN